MSKPITWHTEDCDSNRCNGECHEEPLDDCDEDLEGGIDEWAEERKQLRGGSDV